MTRRGLAVPRSPMIDLCQRCGTAPDAGRSFANRNPVHTCARPGDLDQHFADTDRDVRAAFDQVLAAVSAFGPVQVLPEKTRIALHARMSFAALPRAATGSVGTLSWPGRQVAHDF